MRIAPGELRKADPVEHRLDAGLDLCFGDAAQLETIGDVLEHRAMGPQRIRCDHETEAARLGRQIGERGGIVEHGVAHADGAAMRHLETRYGA